MAEIQSNPLQSVFEGLAAKNPQLKEVGFESFQADMQDSVKLQSLYDGLSSKNPQLKERGFDGFKTDMFGEVQPEQPQTFMQKELRDKGLIQDEQPKEEQGFIGKLGSTVGNSFMTGMNNLNSWAADAPAFIYDLAGAPFRAVGLNVPTSQDFKDTPLQGISDFYKGNAKAYEQKVEQANPSRGNGVIASFENGDIEGGVLNLLGGIAESAPVSIAMMLSGGATAPTIIGGAAIFGAGKAQEMDENAPEMDYDKRRVIAALNGTLEGVFETYLGSGAVGKSLAGIIKNEGKEIAQQSVKRSMSTLFADMITKNPWLAPLGEGLEEVGTQISQNFVDKFSGYKPNLNLTDGVGDSFLSGVGMGGIHGAVIGLAKKAMEEKQQPSGPASSDTTPQFTVNPRDTKEAELRQQAEGFASKTSGNIQTVEIITMEGTENIPGFVTGSFQQTDPDGKVKTFYNIREVNNPNVTHNTSSESIIEVGEQAIDDFVNGQMGIYDQTTQQQELLKKNQVQIDGIPYILTGDQTKEGYVAINPEDGSDIVIPASTVDNIRNSGQENANIVTQNYGKTQVSGIKNEDGSLSLSDPVTEEQANALKEQVEKSTGGNATVKADLIPNEDATAPQVFQLSIIPKVNEPINNESITTDTSGDNGLKAEPVDELFSQPTERKIITQPIGKDNIDFVEGEDFDEVVATDKMPLEKALPILEKKFKDHPKVVVVAEKVQVEVPGKVIKGETKWDDDVVEPSTTKTVIKSIKIVPKEVIARQKQADTDILLDILDEYNATPESRTDVQKASDIEVIAKKLGYQTERTPMNQIRLFDNSGTIEKPKTQSNDNTNSNSGNNVQVSNEGTSSMGRSGLGSDAQGEKQNLVKLNVNNSGQESENVSNNLEATIENQIVENVNAENSLQKEKLQNEESEKSSPKADGKPSVLPGENTPQAQQGHGNEKGLEENVIFGTKNKPLNSRHYISALVEQWTVSDVTKTRGGQEAVVLSKLYVEDSKTGERFSKEYADANGIKYINEPTEVSITIATSDLPQNINPTNENIAQSISTDQPVVESLTADPVADSAPLIDETTKTEQPEIIGENATEPISLTEGDQVIFTDKNGNTKEAVFTGMVGEKAGITISGTTTQMNVSPERLSKKEQVNNDLPDNSVSELSKPEIIEEKATEVQVISELKQEKKANSDLIFKEQKKQLLDDLLKAEDLLLGNNVVTGRAEHQKILDDKELSKKLDTDIVIESQYEYTPETLPAESIAKLNDLGIQIVDWTLGDDTIKAFEVDVYKDGSIKVASIRTAINAINKRFPMRTPEKNHLTNPATLKGKEQAFLLSSLGEAERLYQVAKDNLEQANKSGLKGMISVMKQNLEDAQSILDAAKRIDYPRNNKLKQMASDKEFQGIINPHKGKAGIAQIMYDFNLDEEQVYDIISANRPSELSYNSVFPLILADQLKQSNQTVDQKIESIQKKIDEDKRYISEKKWGKSKRDQTTKYSYERSIKAKENELDTFKSNRKAIEKVLSPVIPEIPVSEDGLYQIYTTKVKLGDEIKTMYGVPSIKNKASKGAGDGLHETLNQAIDEAKYNREQEVVQEQEHIEREQQKATDEAALAKKKENNKGKSIIQIMNEAKTEKILDAKMNVDGVIKTRREHVQEIISKGGYTETREVNKIKELSRQAYNRMDGYQQEAHERRVKEGGTKTEYRLYQSSGSFYDVTKAEYDFANSLIAVKAREEKKQGEKLINRFVPTIANEKKMEDAIGLPVYGRDKKSNSAQINVGKNITDTEDSEGFFTFVNEIILAGNKIDPTKPFFIAYFGDNSGNKYERAVISQSSKEVLETVKNWDQQEVMMQTINPESGLRQSFVAYPIANEYDEKDLITATEKQSTPLPEEKPTPAYGANNKIVSNERAEELRKRLRDKLNNLNAGFDPELLAIGTELAAYHIESGARKFADFSKRMIEDVGEAIKPYLKSIYNGARDIPGMEEIEAEMTEYSEVKKADIDQIVKQVNDKIVKQNKENQDVSNRPDNSQPDSGKPADEVPGNEANVSGRGNGSRKTRVKSTRSGSKAIGQSGGKVGSGLFTDLFGEQSDNELHKPDPEQPIEGNDAGDTDGRGSRTDGSEGLPNEQGADGQNNPDHPSASGTFAERTAQKLIQQQAAENIQAVTGDIDNIRETLPFLLSEQQDDVLKAETRFFDPKHQTKELANGKGILFTNGTGTGKTYTGLGVIKRFVKQGKNNILIVVPSEAKVNDWANDGKNLGLNITPLPNTSTGGEGAVVTTYANFRENVELLRREFDLVVYDESHRLMEEKKGATSSTTTSHYAISNKDFSSALGRLQGVHPVWIESNSLFEKYTQANKNFNANMDLMDWQVAERMAEIKKMNDRLEDLDDQKKMLLPGLQEQARQAVERTKVVFLSATPFKGHFNLRYANGILFDWGNETVTNGRGSRVNPEARFFLDNFGGAYEWRYHKLQARRNANADAIAMQEIQFAQKLMSQGVMSGRAIESDKDYSREFPLVALDQAEVFNKALNEIYSEEFDGMADAARAVFSDYNYTTKLFESLKASMSIERIKDHLALGRKVIVFHRRKQANVKPPFQQILTETRLQAQMYAHELQGMEDGEKKDELSDLIDKMYLQIEAFQNKYAGLLKYEQTLNYSPAIDQIQAAFPGRVVTMNGDTKKKDKSGNVRLFNDDNSGKDIFVVQEEAGKEGISLHDTSGKHQRVLISLSLPISSTTALQIEGRPYRIGNESDAIFEYPLLGLDQEIIDFGSKVNKKLSTTENLAIGDQARDLLRSFAEGVLFNSGTDKPHINQGKGGKEYDKKAQETLSEFRKAVLVYNTNQKTTGRRDQREGVDYFATPEPVGQKMVEWLNLAPEETGLEPSAGHGAIAMWFPKHSNITAIEPSFSLFSKLNARSGGGDKKILNVNFEDFNIINKFNGIAMNPPFGSGGKTAMDHVEKAFHHLKDGGRLVAIIPNGPSMTKRLDAFLYGENDKGKLFNPEAFLIGQIQLPSSAFEQAGTAVSSRIVIIERHITAPESLQSGFNYDLSDNKKIDNLFDEIENIDVPKTERPEPAQDRSIPLMDVLSNGKESVSGVKESTGTKLLPVEEFKHTQTGQILYNVKINGRSDEYDKMSDIGKKHNPYTKNRAYNKYSKGFLFNTKDDAIRFKNEVEGEDNANFRLFGGKESANELSADTKESINILESDSSENANVHFLNDNETANYVEGMVADKQIKELRGGKWVGFGVNNNVFISHRAGSKIQAIATWVHEKSHIQLFNEFENNLVAKRKHFNEMFNRIEPEEIKRVLGKKGYAGATNAQKAEEYYCYLAEQYAITGEITGDVQPEIKNHIFDTVNAFTSPKKIQDVLSNTTNSTTSGNREIERNTGGKGIAEQSNQWGNSMDGRTGSSSGQSSARIDRSLPLTDYLSQAKQSVLAKKSDVSLGEKPMTNKQVKNIFDTLVDEMSDLPGEQETIDSLLMNWNDSELNEDRDKIKGYVGRDRFYSKGKDGGSQTVAKRDFIEWIQSEEPFDTKVYGKEILQNKYWREGIEKAREIVNRFIPKSQPENTILINGVSRSTLNSNGKPIANSEEGIRNFYAWFQNSKVVDAEGRPLVVYHGTKNTSDFSEFDTYNIKKRGNNEYNFPSQFEQFGTFFSNSSVTANSYATDYNKPTEDAEKKQKNIDELYGKILDALKNNDKELAKKIQLEWHNAINEFPSENINDDFYKGVVYPVYLNISSPLIEDAKGQRWSKVIPQIFQSGNFEDKNGIIIKDVIEVDNDIQTTYVVFSPSQIKSATGNNGSFSPDDNNINFKKTRPPLDTFLTNAAEQYQEKKQTRRNFAEVKEKVREFIQDHDLPIRRLEELVKKGGGVIKDNMKPYRDMSNSYGRNETLYKNFSKDKMEPVIKTISKIIKSGVSGIEVLPYMISKHAIERNAYMRENEFKEWEENAKAELQKWTDVNVDIPQATKDRKVKEFNDEVQAKRDELQKKDYSGVKGFDPEKRFDNPDELAQNIVDEFEDKVSIGLVDELWENVKEASSDIVNFWKAGQTMSAEQAEVVKNRYKYFIPLRGWREGAAKQLAYKKGDGFASSLQKAKGRTSFAENPLAYLQQTAFKAIGEQVDNEVKTSLLNLVTGNYDSEFQKYYHLKKAYYVKVNLPDGTFEWEMTMERPSEEMFASGDAKTKIYEQYQKLRTPSQAHEHEIYIKRPNGDMIVVMSDEMLPVAQAMNHKNTMYRNLFTGQINDAEFWNKPLSATFGVLNNTLKAMYTAWNVVFPLTNFARDIQEASITQFIKGDSGHMVLANYKNAFPAIIRDLRGKTPTGKYGMMLQEFRSVGGNTGFTHLKTPEQLEKEIKADLNIINRKGTFRGYTLDQLIKVKGGIEAWNQVFEDATRFSVYITSRDNGKSMGDAASDAKEASVNFNRKGKSSKAFDSIWAFWNVAIQSMQKNVKLAKDHPGRFSIVAGSWLALGFLEAMFNDWAGGDDDEDYFNISEYVRENYLIIPNLPALISGEKSDKYLRIPLPQFWRGFKSAGSLAYDVMNGKMDVLSAAGKGLSNFMGGMLPIDMGGFVQDGEFSIAPIVPTIYRTINEIDENRDYMGFKIAKEPFTKEQQMRLADSGLGKDNVNPAIKFCTDWLFRAGGGDNENKFYTKDGVIKQVPGFLDINPSMIEHLITGYTGGTGRFIDDALTTAMQAVNPNTEVDFKNAPFLNSFFKKIPEAKWKIIGEYYDLKSDGNESKFDALKTSYFNQEDKTKFKELAPSGYYNEFNATLDAYDEVLTQKMKYMDYKTAEGSEEVTNTMKEAIQAIKEVKQKYNR